METEKNSAPEGEEGKQEKQRYIEKMIQQLRQWDSEIQKLESKANAGLEDFKSKHKDKLDDLRAKKAQAEAKLGELGVASSGAWQELKVGFEKSWEILSDSFKNAWTHFSKDADKNETTQIEEPKDSSSNPQ